MSVQAYTSELQYRKIFKYRDRFENTLVLSMAREVSDGLSVHLHRSKHIDIEFENIIFSIKHGKERKQVIKGVSGLFKSGELTAIMGPSGAGKTTLLNILTGFQISGTTGSIKCNRSQLKTGASQYKKNSCYILQDDHLCPLFTVKEVMNMAAHLKIGPKISRKGKKYLINDVLNTLGLLHCKETRCQSLSGGQRKRLSIALELIDNPPIMFLDEPTTGLDSLSSYQCISTLKTLAQQGRTIICTIHQPSAMLYEFFDHVYILAEGRCVYQGASMNTVPYLASVGLICPKYHNPADFMLEVANGEHGSYIDILAKKATERNWRSLEKISNYSEDVTAPLAIIEEMEPNDNFTPASIKPPSEVKQFWILLKRTFLQMNRDWTISYLKLVLHILVGIFLGLTFNKAGNDGSKTLNNIGLLIVSQVYLIYTTLMPAVLKFPLELAILKKERFNNWYNLKTYYMAFLFADIPLQIIYCIAYTVFSYFISCQPMEWMRYIMVQFIFILITLIASSFGLFLGTIVNPVNGTFLGAILTAFFIVVAGFLMQFPHMSKIMYSLSYFSYIGFGYEALVVSIYGYNRSPIPCPEDVEYCHYRFPEVLLKELGMEHTNYWNDVLYLVSNIVILRIAGFWTLKRKLSPN